MALFFTQNINLVNKPPPRKQGGKSVYLKEIASLPCRQRKKEHYAVMFLLPYYLQKQHGMSASLAGLAMLPMSVALIITAPISGAISDKFDSRIVCGVGMGGR
jgi:hypothetical protein